MPLCETFHKTPNIDSVYLIPTRVLQTEVCFFPNRCVIYVKLGRATTSMVYSVTSMGSCADYQNNIEMLLFPICIYTYIHTSKA